MLRQNTLMGARLFPACPPFNLEHSMIKILPAVVLAACLASISTPANATTMVQLSTIQMVDASDAIVRGTITEVWAEEDENGIVWTRAQIEVSQTYKGKAKKKAFIVDQLGGNFGGNVSSVPGAARFSPGEEGVFFLEHLESGRTTTVGWSQGKYTLRLDPYSREFIAQRFAPAPGQDYDHRFLPLPTEAKKLFLADLEDTIQGRIDAGWDGQLIPGTSMERLRSINVKEVVR
jgi:hypothetical protein